MRFSSIVMGTLLIVILIESLLIFIYTTRIGDQSSSERFSSVTSSSYITPSHTVLPTTGLPINEYLSITCYYGLIGNWSYSLVIYPNGTGIFTIEYTGNNSLNVEKALLPLIAGLQFIIERSSGNQTIRKVGSYYYPSAVIEPGTKDSMRLSLHGAHKLYVYGSILGKVPFRAVFTLYPINMQLMRNITIITCPMTITTRTTIATCELYLENSYPEPLERAVAIKTSDIYTIISDGIIQLSINKLVSNSIIEVDVLNNGDSAIYIPQFIDNQWGKIRIINMSADGKKFISINRYIPLIAPTFTTPPIPCRTSMNIVPKLYILYPGHRRSITIHIVREVEGIPLRGWVYAEISIKYIPIKEIHRVYHEGQELSYYRAIIPYKERTITFTILLYIS
ncbi:MAG: hypothetical protein DRO15_04470 [Thermoprotei archaeon]|nr:MAG: hypothetical protein DRO15_04470 [Thermoprotei archaeon]